MKRTNLSLSDISLNMCPLTQDNEGKLRGGFTGITGDASKKPGGNSGCTNGTCENTSCRNAKCDNTICSNVECANIGTNDTCLNIDCGMVSGANNVCSNQTPTPTAPEETNLSTNLFI